MTKCDYCGRFGRSASCAGCGASVNIGSAVIYDPRIFNRGIESRPGMNIPLKIDSWIAAQLVFNRDDATIWRR